MDELRRGCGIARGPGKAGVSAESAPVGSADGFPDGTRPEVFLATLVMGESPRPI